MNIDNLLIELAKHGPLAVLLFWFVHLGSKILEEQLKVSNAQRNREIDSGIKAAEEELKILALRHESATEHEQASEEILDRQSGLLERISRALESLAGAAQGGNP